MTVVCHIKYEDRDPVETRLSRIPDLGQVVGTDSGSFEVIDIGDQWWPVDGECGPVITTRKVKER